MAQRTASTTLRHSDGRIDQIAPERELNETSVAGALHNAPVMARNRASVRSSSEPASLL
jgi:hypothetical protein